MGLNDTPSANRIHIGFFGKRNVGKSSVVNAVTGQELSIVSEQKGTTTDPVFKSMELLPLGPVLIIDTPGMDDEGALGELRVQKTKQILQKTDLAVLVVDGTQGLSPTDRELLTIFQEKEVPYVVAFNKGDIAKPNADTLNSVSHGVVVSARTGEGIQELKEALAHRLPADGQEQPLVEDLLAPGDFVVLVIPIDSSAPKGRLILPQQQVIRAALEAGAVTISVKDTELQSCLAALGQAPAMVITDSQVFRPVSQVVPKDILLTSFSILMARKKGFLETAVQGVTALDFLEDNDRVLIAEGCTHHKQCEDIGTVKLPAWIQRYTSRTIRFEFSSGTGFPEDLSPYRLVVHCGGCMLNEREMCNRMQRAVEQRVPFTNYGIAIAYLNGILERSLEPFPDVKALLP